MVYFHWFSKDTGGEVFFLLMLITSVEVKIQLNL